MKKLHIAIIGAGIAGLTTAILTAGDGHDITLFERFRSPRPVGSGLVIQPVGLAVLQHIGIENQIRALSSPIHRMLGDEAQSGRRILDVSYPAARPGNAIHRGSLFTILWDRFLELGLPVVTQADITGAPPDGDRRNLILRDGRSFGPFDLIIDASGANSPLTPLKTRPLGYGALWANVPWPDTTGLSRDQLRQKYRAARNMAGVLPIGHLPGDPTPMAAIFWSLPVGTMEQWRKRPLADWKDQAQGLWPQMQPFLEQITDHDQLTPAIYRHGTLLMPYAPALVHLGDAAHQTSPQLGQGANMALLDALAITVALRGHDLRDALADYAAMRRWHIWSYYLISAAFTPMYQSDSRALPFLRDLLLAPASRLPGIRGLLARLVAGDLVPPLAAEHLP